MGQKYINIHTHIIKCNEDTISLVNLYPQHDLKCYNKNDNFSVGIHPWHINNEIKDQMEKLWEISKEPQVLAIGETGLDKRCNTDFNLQKKVFQEQIEIAKSRQKPLIIHCVKAWNEIFQILEEAKINVPVLFHGFRGKPQLAKEIIKYGYYLSFGKYFNKESLKTVSSNFIFVETDDCNCSIEDIYKNISEIKKIPLESLIQTIKNNFDNWTNKESRS